MRTGLHAWLRFEDRQGPVAIQGPNSVIGMKKAFFYSLFMLVVSPCVAAPLAEDAFDTISISAEEASEDVLPGILHLKGNFLMRSTDWHLTSAKATVYGSPNKPDRVFLEGSPARFLVLRSDTPGKEPIEATATVIEYYRDTNSLSLSGGAKLMLGDEVVHSNSVEYDIDANHYQTGGNDGVFIKVVP